MGKPSNKGKKKKNHSLGKRWKMQTCRVVGKDIDQVRDWKELYIQTIHVNIIKYLFVLFLM